MTCRPSKNYLNSIPVFTGTGIVYWIRYGILPTPPPLLYNQKFQPNLTEPLKISPLKKAHSRGKRSKRYSLVKELFPSLKNLNFIFIPLFPKKSSPLEGVLLQRDFVTP